MGNWARWSISKILKFTHNEVYNIYNTKINYFTDFWFRKDLPPDTAATAKSKASQIQGNKSRWGCHFTHWTLWVVKEKGFYLKTNIISHEINL